jgi:hypothetical protein
VVLGKKVPRAKMAHLGEVLAGPGEVVALCIAFAVACSASGSGPADAGQGGVDGSSSGSVGADGGVESGSGGGPTSTCRAPSECPAGLNCCVVPVRAPTSACVAGPCPQGQITLCDTSVDCPSELICGPYSGVKSCQGPGAAEAGASCPSDGGAGGSGSSGGHGSCYPTEGGDGSGERDAASE